jgi:hypothetical protein
VPPALRPVLQTIEAWVPGAIARVVKAVRPNLDAARLTPALLLWILRDERFGLINLTRRDDVRRALLAVCDVLALQAKGVAAEPALRDAAELRAEAAQRSAWRAMKFRIATEGVPRVEWMVATAVLISIDHYGASVAEALHYAMVAWGAPDPARQEVAPLALSCAALAHLLALLAEVPA